MEKVKPGIKDDVAETLLIPLFLRSEETKLPKGIIKDPKACEMVKAIDYDFSPFVKAKNSALGTVIRVRHFDNKTRSFIDKHEKPIVVLVGCGLDTRYHRISNRDKAIFYEVDLPEVIELREKFLEPCENDIYVRASMFDTEWMDMLKDKHPDGNFIFVFEGVFMYFEEEQVKDAICKIAARFSKSELHFDAISVFASKKSHLHDSVKYMNAKFKWGLDDETVVEAWAPNIKHVDTQFYMNQERNRWGILMLILTLIPAVKKSGRILCYSVE